MSGLPNVTPFVSSTFPSATSTVILAVYNAQADKIAAANRANLAFNAESRAIANDLASGLESNQIVLTLSATSVPAAGATVRPTNYATAGNPPVTKGRAATTQPIATIVFDISPLGGVGFAQSITDHTEAHQSIHQTAGGFYVDDFGLKPGDFSIEAIVVFTSNVATQVQVFKDLLVKAKLITGPQVTPPPTLLYTNTVDGRTLVLTQTSLDIAQQAANPNMATVTIRGSILNDYATAGSPLVAPGTPAAVAAVDLNLSTTSGTGSDIINNSTAHAGTAALR